MKKLSIFSLIWRTAGLLAVTMFVQDVGGQVSAQENHQMVRMAKIVVDSAQLENYRAALKEGITTAVRVEPGVLAMFAVYDKNQPTHVTVLEVYRDEDAYESHLKTPHFVKYKTTTLQMVKSLELVDVLSIGLETKPR